MAQRPAPVSLRLRRALAERSNETRGLLLDATIQSPIDRGYRETSTTDVVRRAGLTREAQVHHFPRQIDLVQAATLHLARKVREELHVQAARLTSGQSRDDAAITLL